MSSPSIEGKFPENAQEVRFSDDATWMSHRNDGNFPKRAGKGARLGNDLGRFSLGYFSLARQRKVIRQEAKQKPKKNNFFF